MPKQVTLRDDRAPQRLIVLRLGTNTLNDRALGQSCERAYARCGLHAFSVLEIPNGNYELLGRLEPLVRKRRKFLEASGPDLLAAGFVLVPTLAYPHWSVVLSQPTPGQFEKVRGLFHGPVDNPVWEGR